MEIESDYSKSDYLAVIAERVAAHKKRTYDLMRLNEGDKALDVGCGPATDTIALAALVGQTGHVCGVDIDPDQISLAREKAVAAGVEGWTTHQQVAGQQLPFESNYFDAARSERVFQHNADADALLKEMLRVTKPGGWIIVLDTDWSTMSIDTDLSAIEQKIKTFHVEKVIKNGYSGRKLQRLFIQNGLTDLQVELAPTHITDYRVSRLVTWYEVTEQAALDAEIISWDELTAFHDDLERRDAQGKFFATLLQILVAGRKPVPQPLRN